MAFATGSSIFFFLILLPLLGSAQSNNGTVHVGKFIIADDNASPWLSPNQNFGFGFHKPDGEDQFLLSIWFHQIPNKSIVWWATDDDGQPLRVPSRSKVQLNAQNGLVLINPGGKEMWSTSNTPSDQVTYGLMNDTGNFVIQGPDSKILWQSFDHPTDTLLPTQIMNINEYIFARNKESNFSQGKFQLRMRGDGNLVLETVPSYDNRYDAVYYSSHTNDAANESNSGSKLVFDESADVYVLRKNGQKSIIGTEAKLPTPNANFYYRVTLDFDGVFALYYYPKSGKDSENWFTVWSKPDDICSAVGQLGSGACGFNSICSLNNGRPTCNCPKGLSLFDPDDAYGSCKWNIALGGYQEDVKISMEDLYYLEEINDTNWPTTDYERDKHFSEESCKTSCLHDCMCAVAIFGGGGCWKKKLPLSNGRVNPNGMPRPSSNSVKVKILLKERIKIVIWS